jgi:tetratricopeptide (TPR) repeat protein
MKSVDKYLFQALDNYPYWLEGTIESLDYALSYDDKNTTALCLYGRIHAEQLQDYEGAKNYFQQAISIDIHSLEVYPYYIETLLLNEDFEEAQKLIDFALTIKGVKKVEIKLKLVSLLERQLQFKKALKLLKKIMLELTTSDYNHQIEETEKRLKLKLETNSNDKKKKRK